ncbi:MAG TPA: hypothetical protein VMB71_02585 [Acetobacteraceae bacterium]|nr:hypothetical protein [Acetobacteraceae bacterium]
MIFIWRKEKKESSFSEEKEAKRLLSMTSDSESGWVDSDGARNGQKFFGSFFQKRTACLPFFSNICPA